MRLNILGKLCQRDRLKKLSEEYRGEKKRIVLCHGCFDILHPGHLRYLQFARKQGDVLFVSLTTDSAIVKADGTRPYVPQELRAESLAALEFVDHVVLSEAPTACDVIEQLKPDLYIKGKDCENSREPGFLLERDMVEAFGGKVIFSSGEVVFSSTTILDRFGGDFSVEEFGSGSPFWFSLCCQRWGVTLKGIDELLSNGAKKLKIAVIGDASFDRYFNCDAGQVSTEAPVLTVKPVDQIDYLAGATGIASHLNAQGVEVHAFFPAGNDRDSQQALQELDRLGIHSHTWHTRRNFPVRERYFVGDQMLLQVDRVEVQPIDSQIERGILKQLSELKSELDAVIFCDSGFGFLNAGFLSRLALKLRPEVKALTGSVSGPRKSLFSMQGFDLVVPTERDLRSVTGDFELDLPSVASNLIEKLNLKSVAVHLDQKGCVLFQPRQTDDNDRYASRPHSEYLPNLAQGVVDATGALEAFIAMSTIAFSCDGSPNLAAYLGASGAAYSMEHSGNVAASTMELLAWLERRPELVEDPPTASRLA